MRVTLIHNPGAGSDAGPDAERLCALLEAHGHAVRYQSATDGAWRSVLGAPADLVAVAGGDGTVGRVARELVGRSLPLTVLPTGTANNISRTMGLADQPLAELVAGWGSGREVAVDVGTATGPWGRRHFMEGFGAGLFACTVPEADRSGTLESLDDSAARLAYALQLLRERLADCPPHALAITVDGRDLSGEYVLFEAMNLHYVGPNLYLAPAGDLDDGRLDVLLVTAAERTVLAHYLANWQHGMLWPAELPTYRAERVELDWNGDPIHADDRVWSEPAYAPPAAPARVVLEVSRRALRFLVPAAA